MSESSYKKYVSVVLDVAIDKTLDYGVPENFIDLVRRGIRVEVPVRGKNQGGYIYDVKDFSEFSKVKPVHRVVSDTELIAPDMFELGLWISRYYCAPLHQVFKSILPASLRKEIKPKQQYVVLRKKTREELRAICEELRNKSPAQAAVLDVMLLVNKEIFLSELLEKTGGSKSPVNSLVKRGCLEIDLVRLDRSPLVNEEYFLSYHKKLNEDQQIAFNKINEALSNNRFETHLLYGITGSGKTEIYLQAIDKALSLGKGAIMLVPEISLTEQTIQRFKSRFKDRIAILHCRLSDGERSDEWHHIQKGEAKIVIGARSAIFSPVQNLGLIVVDEEHESSYKQTDEAPCYNARDVAVMRAKMSQSVVILGSATPSLESYYNAVKGKYILSKLSYRPDSATRPTVTIVDMKKEYERTKGFTCFSEALLDGIKKRASVGEQTILFLNRRGYHTTLICQQCHESIKCSHCDVALTFHLGENILSCHLCGFTVSPPPKECPKCRSSQTMKFKGVGTELLETSLHAVFPEIRTIRADADTTRHKGSHQKLFRDFGTGKADVLIGTQMITKGLHFPEVTLVGVINCDMGLNIPDFRASETVFQLITQVAGRAGRGVIPGEVIIQTCVPDNSTIKHAANQDYEAFYNEEIGVREIFEYPPLQSMARLTFSGLHQHNTLEFANGFRKKLAEFLPPEYQIHPVLPAVHAKVKDKFRFQLIIRGPNAMIISRSLDKTRQEFPFPSGIKLLIDINPL